MSDQDRHPIDILSLRYTQLTMPIEEGIRQTEEYRNVCLRGEEPTRQPDFTRNENDRIETINTPAGDVEVLTLFEREDFEHAYLALANRCEPMEIPKSMGAATLFGLNNWEKIRALTIPLSLADKSLYKDIFILLSAGPYSNVDGAVFGINEPEWISKSVTIRKYHELTHFISRTLYPENRNAIRDEIMADMIGILFAFGRYDTFMAKKFLGIEGNSYRDGGRLQNYIQPDSTLEKTIEEANYYIDTFSSEIIKEERPFDTLIRFENGKTGLNASAAK